MLKSSTSRMIYKSVPWGSCIQVCLRSSRSDTLVLLLNSHSTHSRNRCKRFGRMTNERTMIENAHENTHLCKAIVVLDTSMTIHPKAYQAVTVEIYCILWRWSTQQQWAKPSLSMLLLFNATCDHYTMVNLGSGGLQDEKNELRAKRTMTMYIQYFCKKDFSGTGTMGSPSAVSGGGVVSSGLVRATIEQQKWVHRLISRESSQGRISWTSYNDCRV
jgi:hypothetical protein